MERNFKFKKSLGQNFLIDKNVVNKIINNSDLDKNTLAIEIGPGSGAISKKIADLCGYLLCYEIDESLEKTLVKEFSNYNNISVKFVDFLTADILSDISGYDYDKLVVVANLPYYITTPIINKFINENIMPDEMIIMVQKEVALRFSAKPGSKNYNSLSVYLNYHYDVNILFDVSNTCFIPKPKVDSSVLKFVLKKNKLVVNNMDLFYILIRDSFKYKRKTLKNNLKDYDLNKISNILKKYNLDLSVRAENIKLDVFVDIANNL